MADARAPKVPLADVRLGRRQRTTRDPGDSGRLPPATIRAPGIASDRWLASRAERRGFRAVAGLP